MDLGRWNQRSPVVSPVLGPYFAIAYDAVRRRVVAVTGGATWEWDGITWAQVVPTASPGTSEAVTALPRDHPIWVG